MKITELKTQNDAPFTDLALIKTVEIGLTKKQKEYAYGNLVTSDKETHSYKIWDTTLVEQFKILNAQQQETGNPIILIIHGKTNIYMESFGVVISLVENPPETVKFTDFLVSDYNPKELMERLMGTASGLMSKEVGQLANSIFSKDGRFESFAQSISAINHHDNQIHGLLAHTTKMMDITKIIIPNYPNIFKTQRDIDIFVFGLLIHDLGKIEEYYLYGASDRAFLGHRYLGALMIEELRPQFEEVLGQNGTDHLVSIVLQHHGVYDERPKTSLAFAVHLVDAFEARFTDLNEKVGDALESCQDKVFIRTENKESLRLVLPKPTPDSPQD